MWYRESFSNCLYSTTVWGFELERMLPGGISQSFAYDNIGRLVDSKTRQYGTIHRFGNSNDGTVHWNGSTNSPRGIKVPLEVLKRFNDEGYTPAPNATYKKK